LTAVYGNGWQTVLQFIGLCWGLCWRSSQESSSHRLWKRLANSPPIYRIVLEKFSGKQSSPLMETAGKQFSPFMELFVQLCLTAWATVSYCLGNCVLLFGQLCLTAWAIVSYCLGNCVLLLVEMLNKQSCNL
jgi:hypothetical protein